MQNSEFYQQHLNHVSRSFAFCIARLKEPFRTWVALSYLLCRSLDTAEDALWTHAESKLHSLLEFKSFIEHKPSFEKIQNWISDIPTTIKKEEAALLEDLALLLEDFYELKPSVQNKLRQAVVSMSEGMIFYSRQHKTELKLLNLVEVNNYCFFVAGLVGELLTDLVKEIIPENKFSEDIYLKSYHFGLFLQKINLLKDQSEDEKQGRFLVPDRNEMIASLLKNARGAVDYLISIPRTQKEFRLFCAWSLFLGLSSLNWIEKAQLTRLFSLNSLSNKLPRWMTEKLLAQVEDIIENDQALLKLFQEMLPPAQSSTPDSTPLTHHTWAFSSIYKGALTSSDLADLGLV